MTYEYPYDDWAEIYDEVYAELDHDIPFYTAQAGSVDGQVLELGCGTGRVSLAMAAAGASVVGIDISPLMIEVAQQKATAKGLAERCIFQTGDMASVQVAGTYGMVTFPFRSFQSMLTVEEQLAALGTAARHLRPGGLLAMDTFNPDVHQLADERDSAVPFHLQDVKGPNGGTIVIWGQNGWDGVEQINASRLIIEWLDARGEVTRRMYRDFDLRYTFRYEMEHLLTLAGFEVEAVYGDFEGGPVEQESDDLVWLARRR